jgi:hypothetical protein
MRKEDIKIFIDGIENPAEPNQALKDAAERYQERSYSEEEVLEIIRQYALEEHLITSSKPNIWFEQFKKK